MRRRVVITGIGSVTGFGAGTNALWEGLLEGRTALRRIKAFDPAGMRTRLGAEVEGFSARSMVPKSYRKAVKVMARDIELAVGAAREAVEDAGLVTKFTSDGDADAGATPTYGPRRVGCHIGAGLIACEIDELTMALQTARGGDGEVDLAQWGESGMGNLPPLWLLKYLPNMLACHVTIIHDAQGPSNTITCAEASGLLSLDESTRVIERGEADVCFTGGAESKVNPMGMIRMDFAGRLAHTGDSEDGVSFVRPYDEEAPGQLLGEMGGVLIVEAKEKAEARGVRAYAEVAGVGAGQSPMSGDAEARGEGLATAIDNALEDAGATPDQIDAIAPHASGIAALDAAEAAGLRKIFGDRLERIPTITLTPAIGEGMAGNASVSVGAAALCLRHQTLPARLHGSFGGEMEGEGVVGGMLVGPARQRDAQLRRVLVCTGALGGQNAACVLERV